MAERQRAVPRRKCSRSSTDQLPNQPAHHPGRRQFIACVGAFSGSAVWGATLDRAIAAPDELPPKGPMRREPPQIGTRVQIGEGATDGPTWHFASRSLLMPWRTNGGDWIDDDGLPNGTRYAAVVTVKGGRVPYEFTIANIVKRLLVSNTGILMHAVGPGTTPKFKSRESDQPPVLNVDTDKGTVTCPCIVDTWIDPTSNQSIGGAFFGLPGLIKFDLSNVNGTVHRATLILGLANWYGVAVPVAADYLDMPALISDPVSELGGVRNGIASTVATERDLAAHKAIIFYSECSSEAAIKSKWSFVSGNYPNRKVCINPQFVQWPEVGLVALRMESQSPRNKIPGDSGSSILTWREYPAGGQKLTELYTRYLLRIDPDVGVGMNELGVKLPGLEGNGFSARMEHGPPSAANPGVFRLWIYWYGADRPFNGNLRGSGERKTSVCLRAGQLYSIEQHIKLNTINADGSYNSDGVIEIWVDGVPVYQDLNTPVSAIGGSITSIPFANFFHGGTALPRAPMHYEFSGVATSRQYIGPPKGFPEGKRLPRGNG